MKVLKPVTFTEDRLVASDVTELYSNWSSASTYAVGDRVVYDSSIWESAVASNTNNIPSDTSTKWTYVSPTNRLAMFDSQISTQTTNSSGIEVTIRTGAIDAIYLGNLGASSVVVTARETLGGTITFQQTYYLSDSYTITNWYDYFFSDPLERKTQLIVQGIPSNSGMHVTIKINSSGTAACGICLFGNMRTLGTTDYGATAGITDYSKKETDTYGNTTFVERKFTKKLSATVTVLNSNLNVVQKALYELRATPSLWIASDDERFEETLIVYGFYKDFTTAISYPQTSLCSLEIEGLI